MKETGTFVSRYVTSSKAGSPIKRTEVYTLKAFVSSDGY